MGAVRYAKSTAPSWSSQSGPPWASPEEVYIGADPGCGKRCQWNGIIDEVVIFDTVLSDDDVVKLGEGIEGALAVEAAGKIATTWILFWRASA